MRSGAFAVGLPVADRARSRDLYARPGFEPVDGTVADGYLVLRDGSAAVGRSAPPGTPDPSRGGPGRTSRLVG